MSGEPTDDGARVLDGVRILVAEDDDSQRLYLADMLEWFGAEVTCAGSAPAALRAWSRRAPDVVVTDLGLPEEELTTLVTRAVDTGVPMIALTGRAQTLPGVTTDAVQLLEPSSPDALCSAIQRLARNGASPAPRDARRG